MKTSHSIIGTSHASKLTYKNRKFYLHIPEIAKVKDCPSDTWCAIDPGLRDFMTIWSSKGESHTYGRGKFIDDLINRKRRTMDNFDDNKRKEKKFKDRIRRRIKGVVTDLHWKTANNLCRRYSEIAIGKLSTIGIVRNAKRTVLGAFNKDKAYALSHFRFRERLKYKCAEYGRIYHL
jgi:putative transposase